MSMVIWILITIILTVFNSKVFSDELERVSGNVSAAVDMQEKTEPASGSAEMDHAAPTGGIFGYADYTGYLLSLIHI